jgi:hypothetical protein
MTKALIKTSAIACVFCGFTFAAPAYAINFVPVNGADRIVISAADEKTTEEESRPSTVIPGEQAAGQPPQGGTTPPAEGPEDPGEQKKGEPTDKN